MTAHYNTILRLYTRSLQVTPTETGIREFDVKQFNTKLKMLLFPKSTSENSRCNQYRLFRTNTANPKTFKPEWLRPVAKLCNCSVEELVRELGL